MQARWIATLACSAILATAVSVDAQAPEPQEPAIPLRVHLRWSGAAAMRLVVVRPGGVPVDTSSAHAGVTASEPATDGQTGEWLEWAVEPAPGRYLVCALGDAGAGTRVTLEVQQAGRTGTRSFDLTGYSGRPCTEQSRGFLLGISLQRASAAAATQPAPPEAASNCVDGRVAVDGGYCCWPGQRFDDAAGRCVGPPRCPSGLAAAGAECVRTAAPPAPVPTPPSPQVSAPAPSWGGSSGGAPRTIHLHARTAQAQLSLQQLTGSTTVSVYTGRTWGTAQVDQFTVICNLPCDVEIPPGTYQLGVALGTNNALRAGPPIDLRSDTTLDVTYDDRSVIRIMGWITLAVGDAAGLAVALAGIGQSGGLVGGLIGGGVLVAVGTIAGMIMALLNDSPSVVRVGDGIRF